MKTTEMKETLFKKLKAENTYFTKQDIHISKVNDEKYVIIINDYQPINFRMTLSIDDFDNTYEVTISKYYNNEFESIVSLTNSRKAYDIEYALIELGYYIATRF